MEFKRCDRCGCFFMSEDDVCCLCKTKDKADSIKLHDYLEGHPTGTISSLEELSINTGISIKTLNRFGGIKGIDNILNGFNVSL